MEYLRIKGRNVVHTLPMTCHYFQRSMRAVSGATEHYTRKPRDCSVCDECQRQMKLMRRQKTK